MIGFLSTIASQEGEGEREGGEGEREGEEKGRKEGGRNMPIKWVQNEEADKLG